MKTVLIYSIFCMLFFAKKIEVYSQVYIAGKINGKSIHRVAVNMPINGISNESVYASTLASQLIDNLYELSVPISEIVCLKVSFDNEPVWIVAQPGDSIFINVDFSKDIFTTDSALMFEGSNAAGNFLFNKINFYPAQKFKGVFSLFAHVPQLDKEALLRSFKDSVQIFINRFQHLFSQKLISAQFYKVILYSFKSLLLSEFLRYVTKSKRYSVEFTPDELIQFSDSYIDLPNGVDDSFLLSCYLNENLLNQYNILKFKKNHSLRVSSSVVDSTVLLTHVGEKQVSADFASMLEETSPLIQEHLWGTMIFNFQSLFPTLLKKDDLEFFKIKFPNSIYHSFIKDQFSVAQKSKNECVINDNKEIYFLDTLSKIKSVEQLIDKLKGEGPVYIDLWASWCIPCKQEFSNNSSLDSLLQEFGVKKVFISIDIPNLKEEWKNNIKDYCLKGYHILAGKQLQLDLEKVFFEEGELFSIPRYILISKEGRIISENAPRPSELGELKSLFCSTFGLKES